MVAIHQNSNPKTKSRAAANSVRDALLQKKSAEENQAFQDNRATPYSVPKSASINFPNRTGVVQRALSEPDKILFRQWVEEQIVAQGIDDEFHDALRQYMGEMEVNQWVNDLDTAKQRMNGGNGFPKYVLKTQIKATAQACTRTGDVTLPIALAILTKLGTAGINAVRDGGLTIHVITLPGGDAPKNCHHYAFGGLKGEAGQFNYGTLSGLVDVNGEEGGVVSTSALEGVPQMRNYTVKRYGMAHSARVFLGYIFHKFIDIPAIFCIPGYADAGAGGGNIITVRSSKIDHTGTGTIKIPNEE